VRTLRNQLGIPLAVKLSPFFSAMGNLHGHDHLRAAALRPEHQATMEAELRGWLDRRGHDTVAEIRGRVSRQAVRDGDADERANYLRTLTTITPSRRHR
jgi:GAF domain-containing protein